jgi:hypothetical protein
MRSMANIDCWEEQYVYTHMWVAHRLFRNSHSHQMAEVEFWAKVEPIIVEVHLCL